MAGTNPFDKAQGKPERWGYPALGPIERDILPKIRKDLKLLNNAHKIGSESYDKKLKELLTKSCKEIGINPFYTANILKFDDRHLKYLILQNYFSRNADNHIKNSYEFRSYFFEGYDHVKEDGFGFVDLMPIGSCTIPRGEFTFGNAALFQIHENPFIGWIAKGRQGSPVEDDWGDIGWIPKPAFILIASTLLSIKYGKLNYFLGTRLHYLPFNSYNLKIDSLKGGNWDALKQYIAFIHDVELNMYSIPPESTARHFDFYEEIDIIETMRIAIALEQSDPVFQRAVYYYVKSCSYSAHPMFFEEATALLFFALDGLVKLLLEKYKQTSIEGLKGFLKTKFACPYTEYLEMCYDERTIYVHPRNDLDESWRPHWDIEWLFETDGVVKDFIMFYLFETPFPD